MHATVRMVGSRVARASARLAPGLAVTAAIALASTAHAQLPPPPRATTPRSVDSPDERAPAPPSEARVAWSRASVLVGQQVTLEVALIHSVMHQPSWSAPELPGFLVERLPSQGGAMQRDEQGRAVRLTRFLRVLFPTRAGELSLPASAIVLQDRRGRELRVPVAASSIRVDPLPEIGRPGAFEGGVGDVSVRIVADQTAVSLRGSVAMRIDVMGTAHPAQLPELDLEAIFRDRAEVFPELSDTAWIVRQSELIARRTYRFSLVPRAAGPLELPSIEVPYFDPMTSHYRTASTAPVRLQVTDDPARSVVPSPSRLEPDAMDPGPDRRGASGEMGGDSGPLAPLGGWPYVWLAVRILAVVALIAGIVRYRRAGRFTARSSSASPAQSKSAQVSRGASGEGARAAPQLRVVRDVPTECTAHDELERAAAATSAGSKRALLRSAMRRELVARHGPSAHAWTTAELELHTGDGEAVAIMRLLDRAGFAGTDSGGPRIEDSLERVRAYLSARLAQRDVHDAR